MSDTMRVLFASTSALFYLTAIIGVLVFGEAEARSFALWSAFIAGWLQFAAQDPRPIVVRGSILLAYVAMALGAWALVLL